MKKKIAILFLLLAWLGWAASFFVSDELKTKLKLFIECSQNSFVAQDFQTNGAQVYNLQNAQSLRVCTWNLKNYNLSRRDVDGQWIFAPKPESEKQMICESVLQIRPDVLLVNEIGGRDYLYELRDMLRRRGLNYPHVVFSKNSSNTALGILSKYAPSEVFDFNPMPINYWDNSKTSPRGTLGISLNTGFEDIYIFSLHLKSKVGATKSDENFAPMRFAEIRAIDSLIYDKARLSPVIIGGDFNDEPRNALIDNFLNLEAKYVQQRNAFGDSFTYHWKRRDKFFTYDFFVANPAMMSKLKLPASVHKLDCGSDHSPVFVDIALREF